VFTKGYQKAMQHRRRFYHIPFLLFSCSFFLLLAACTPTSFGLGSATPTQGNATSTASTWGSATPTTLTQVNTTLVASSPGKTLLIYKGSSSGPVLSVAWSPDGKSIASGGFDGTVKLWDVATGKTLRTYSEFHNAFTSKIVWSHDGQRIAVGTSYPIAQDASAYILDANSSTILLTTPKYHQGVTDLAWSPDNALIASLDSSGEIHIWKSSTGELVYSYQALANNLAWSPDGKFIASSSATEKMQQVEITIWNTATHHVASVYDLHSDRINSLSWSADSINLLATTNDNTVMIWDAATGKIRQFHKEQTGDIYSAAWSPNDKLVALAGKDQTVHVFEADTGKTRFIYTEHKSSIYDVAWSPDGRLIASSDDGGTVRIWVAP
jgi:eukaryotic-like serine/threonine-protein kinase